MQKLGVAIVAFAVSLPFAPLSFAQTLIVGNKQEHTVSFIDLKNGQEFARTQRLLYLRTGRLRRLCRTGNNLSLVMKSLCLML